ncbi:MAG TPA: hypothetical protein ENJ54_02625, partial [Chloroflexi bacterium]|nr:hypothetical protein [Chloroflexota bacterium]
MKPVTVTTTDPPATADASFQCGTPGNNGWCRGGANLVFTANEPVSGYVISAIETNLWGYICQPNTASPTCTYAPGDGTGTVAFWAESTYGDSSTQASVAWKVDTTAPVLTPSVPAPDGQNGWFVTSPQVSASGSDATSGLASVQYQVDGGTWQSGETVNLSTDGVHTVVFKAEDVAGNTTTSQRVTVKIDTTAPTLTPSMPEPNGDDDWFVTAPVQIGASAEDATSGVASVECRIDGGAWQTPPVNVTSDGEHVVECEATDNAGNSTSWRKTVEVDTTAPALTASAPSPDGSEGWYV